MGDTMMRLWIALVALAMLAVLAAAACSSDSPCALGGRGWCENGLAAAAVKSVVGNGMDGMFANMVLVVEDGFTIDPDRYSVRNVAGLRPEQTQILTADTVPANLVTLVISDVKISDAPASGKVSAQGTATMTVYNGSAVRNRITVRGRLEGANWIIFDRKAAD
jgi:hypothetical protein